MGKPVYLTVGSVRKLLGQCFEPADVPELLRHVADYYDDNPDACADLLSLAPPVTAQEWLTNPFGGDYAGL